MKPFIICDNNALVMSSGEGDFVLPVSFSRGILSWGIMSGGICPFPIALRCAICIAPNTESRFSVTEKFNLFDSLTLNLLNV